MKGLGAGGRLWELLERKPELPFNGGSWMPLFFFTGIEHTWLWVIRPAVCPTCEGWAWQGHPCHVAGIVSSEGWTVRGGPRDVPESTRPSTWCAACGLPALAGWRQVQCRPASRKGPWLSDVDVCGKGGKKEASHMSKPLNSLAFGVRACWCSWLSRTVSSVTCIPGSSSQGCRVAQAQSGCEH